MTESLASRVAKLEADYHELAADCLRLKCADAFSGQLFQLTNENGDIVAELNTEDGNPHFTLYDKTGQARCVIGLIDGRPHLSLQDQDGNQRLALAEDAASNLGLLMFGRYRRNRVLLGFGSSGEPYLQIAGTDGVIDLDTSFKPGWLGLSLGDESGKYRLTAALDPSDHNGKPFIVLTDHRGRQRWWHGG